jgi:hypothetical protein
VRRITSITLCKDVSYKTDWGNIVFVITEMVHYSGDYVISQPRPTVNAGEQARSSYGRRIYSHLALLAY